MSLGGVSLSYTQIYTASHSVANRLQIPVSAGQVLYAQYRHIQGVAAGPGDATVPLNNLQVMDSLIQALQQRGIKIPKVVEDSRDPLRLIGHLKQPVIPAVKPFVPAPEIKGLLVDLKA